MATGARFTPTLFDKLVADVEISGLQSTDTAGIASEVMRYYPVPEINRFGEAALRATVKRDLAWLLNTTQFGARGELEGFTEVQTSVLNYGVPDLAGRSLHPHHSRSGTRDPKRHSSFRNTHRRREPGGRAGRSGRETEHH